MSPLADTETRLEQKAQYSCRGQGAKNDDGGPARSDGNAARHNVTIGLRLTERFPALAHDIADMAGRGGDRVARANTVSRAIARRAQILDISALNSYRSSDAGARGGPHGNDCVLCVKGQRKTSVDVTDFRQRDVVRSEYVHHRDGIRLDRNSGNPEQNNGETADKQQWRDRAHHHRRVTALHGCHEAGYAQRDYGARQDTTEERAVVERVVRHHDSFADGQHHNDRTIGNDN